MQRRGVPDSWIIGFPIALLLAIALAQIFLAHSAHLVAWKGGGFGMFATIDAPDFRDVRLYDAEGHAREIPSHLAGLDRRVRTFPTRAALRALVQAWEAEHDGIGIVRAEVWRTRISGKPMRVDPDLLVRLEPGMP